MAVVGCGWAGRELWLRRAAMVDEVRVVAVIDPDPRARTMAADLAPESLAGETIDDLPVDDIDLVVIATPNRERADLIGPLLEVGMSVVVEKPAFASREEWLAARPLVERHVNRFTWSRAPLFRADVQQFLQLARELGPPRWVEADWTRARGIPAGAPWMVHRANSGGGSFIDLGWHLLEVVSAVTGGGRLSRTSAVTSMDFVDDPARQTDWRLPRDERRAPHRIDVEDTLRSLIVFDDRVGVAVTTRWASHATFDTTRLRVEAAGGVVELVTTFGFSPHRCTRPRLTTWSHGARRDHCPEHRPVGDEYTRQLASLRDDHRGAGVGSPDALALLGSTVDLIAAVYEQAVFTR
jgi:oxidoreductase